MAGRTSSQVMSAATIAMMVLLATSIFAQQLSQKGRQDQQTAQLVAQMVPKYHLNHVRIDDGASEQLFDRFTDELDPQKLYFLQADIDHLAKFRKTLDDSVKEGNVDFAYEVFDVYRQRLGERVENAHKLIDHDFDFTKEETIETDSEGLPWAKSIEELDERWRKRVKYEVLQLMLDDEPIDEVRDRLHSRYRTVQINIEQMKEMDILEIYLTALANCFDPHSSYMSPYTLEDFQISMRLSLDGIGAALRSEDGYTVVAEVVPGGAADKDGRLQVGDKIIGVDKDGSGELVDIVNMRLSEVVRLIRGPRGTEVGLQVKSKAGGDTVVYKMARQKIELKESEVKGEIIEASPRVGRTGRIGVIKIPSFYRDFDGAQGGSDSFKSAARDVEQVLRDFTRQGGVDGVVVDLRNNGGGALAEAIEVSGHFIDKGPVVQVKAPNGDVTQHRDDRPGVLYSGPLVVLCNRASASASEIFAGVIQDYHRGIIVGDTTTHGKGTVQNVMPVAPNDMLRIFNSTNRGALKLTINQFYRVNGDSTQNRGVPSDVVLPSIFDHWDIGEAFMDNALPFDQIPAARGYKPAQPVESEALGTLREASAGRVKADDKFNLVQDSIQRYLERKNRKTVSLNEATLRAEREEDDKLAKAIDDKLALMEDADGDDPEATPKRDEEVFPENFYNDEVLQIALDYISQWKTMRTVSR